MKDMLLHWSPRSPFVRKVMIAAHECGLADRIETVRTVVAASQPNTELMKENPQSRLPTLRLADGTVVYDSPVITVTSVRREGGRTTVAFDVRDDQSAVQKADYSLDGNRWQTIYPKDGIADSRVEQFELVLEGEAAARGVIVRAADALNNVASARGEAPPAPSAPSGRR